MGTLYEFSGSARHSAAADGLIARMLGDAARAPRRGATIPHPAIAALPLVPCNPRPAPDWSLSRLSEDRFRLTLVAPGLTGDDVTVRMRGGLLHIAGHPNGQPTATDRAAPRAGIDCSFLLLEPLHILGHALHEGRLVVDLERDHATPCRADIPPRLTAAAALALAA